jgi:hypothetical protein
VSLARPDRTLEKLERDPDGGEAYVRPADVAEPHLPRDRRRVSHGAGEMDEADRL